MRLLLLTLLLTSLQAQSFQFNSFDGFTLDSQIAYPKDVSAKTTT